MKPYTSPPNLQVVKEPIRIQSQPPRFSSRKSKRHLFNTNLKKHPKAHPITQPFLSRSNHEILLNVDFVAVPRLGYRKRRNGARECQSHLSVPGASRNKVPRGMWISATYLIHQVSKEIFRHNFPSAGRLRLRIRGVGRSGMERVSVTGSRLLGMRG